MEPVADPKLKALFIISADEVFSDKHPLWNTVQAFRPHYAQIHLAVFVKGSIPEGAESMHDDEQLLVYNVRSGLLLLRLPSVWATLSFNLRWQNQFQPNVVVSYADGIPSLVGYLLALRNKKKFFMEGSSHLLGQAKRSLRFFINRYLLQHAEAVFVPGAQTATLFTSLFSIPPAQLLPVTPAFDIDTLERSGAKYDFHNDHAQYNFYITSVVYMLRDVRTLIAVHSLVRARYPRVALCILVDKSIKASVDRMLKRENAFGIFAYEQDDSLHSYINGSHVYLAVSTEQDIDTMMVTALGLQTPVVTKAYGIAPELFKGTPYEKYMVSDDARAMASAVVSLIEEQRDRTEYGLNTSMLLSRVSFSSTERYAAQVAGIIQEIVLPTVTHTSAGTVTPFLPGEEAVILPNKVEEQVRE